MPKRKILGEQNKIFSEVAEIDNTSAARKKRAAAIKRERRKLVRLLTDNDIADDKLEMADGLIGRAAYMKVTLEEYEEYLNENGHTEPFTQSEKTEAYDRERPIARLYNQMIKNYTQVMVKLIDLLPVKTNPKDLLTQEYESKYFK